MYYATDAAKFTRLSQLEPRLVTLRAQIVEHPDALIAKLGTGGRLFRRRIPGRTKQQQLLRRGHRR